MKLCFHGLNPSVPNPLYDKALDYTLLQQPPPIHLSILSSDAGSPSATVTDLCLFSFHVSFLFPAPLFLHAPRN